MTKNEALKLALEVLENTTPTGFNMETDKRFYDAITAIKEALAQPEQYPQIAINPEIVGYVAPQRAWVGLTQDELNMIGDSMRTWNSWTITDVYFAIEAKLKEKNT